MLAEGKYHNGGGKEKAAEYYENNRDVLIEKPRNKYRNLSEEKKSKRAYGRNRYRNMTEDEKNKLEIYQRNCRAPKY